MQHRVRRHVASLDIRDGRLAAEGAADVVERPRTDTGLSTKPGATDGKRRVGGIPFEEAPARARFVPSALLRGEVLSTGVARGDFDRTSQIGARGAAGRY
jgi:hypothetical protein